MRAADFRPSEIRQPAVFVSVVIGPGDFSDRERAAAPEDYEGALLEGLNARAVLAKDVRLVKTAKIDPRQALGRAREVQADHAILIAVRVEQSREIFCRQTRRPFAATVRIWSQELQVLRASDGATRLVVPPEDALSVADLEPSCDDPRVSRRRSPAETLNSAVDKLLTRLLSS